MVDFQPLEVILPTVHATALVTEGNLEAHVLRDVPRSSFVHLEVLLRDRHGLYVDARLKTAGEDELTAMKPDDVVTVPRANRSSSMGMLSLITNAVDHQCGFNHNLP